MPVASQNISINLNQNSSINLTSMSLLINGSSTDVSYDVNCGITVHVEISSNGSSGLPPNYQLTVYLKDRTNLVGSQTVTVQSNGTWYAGWDVTLGCHFQSIGYLIVFQGYVNVNGKTFYSPTARYGVRGSALRDLGR